jgi:hypothetical protein
MRERKNQLKHAVHQSLKTEPLIFCPECGATEPRNKMTINGNQPREDNKTLIYSEGGIDSESWEMKPEKGISCSACRKLKQEKGQSGQSPRKKTSYVPATCASKNYFTQHWQGEYSLTKSYWINCVFVGVLFQFLLIIYPEELITSTIHDLYIYIAVYCIALTVITWQIGGVWRSANNHIKKTKQKFWANTVKVFMVLVLISSTFMVRDLLPGLNKFTSIFSRDIDITTYSIRVMDNKQEVEITGGIKFGLTKALRKTFNNYPTIKVIHLNSYGGRVIEARLLREFIGEMDLITSTNKGCLSACTIAYMGGASRFVYGEGKLGFHRYGLASNQTDFIKETIVESFMEDKAFFIKKGASDNFMNIIYNTSPSDLWFPENDVLFSNKIITDIAEKRDFLLYQEKASEYHVYFEKVMRDNPLHPVIKEFDPEVYNINI